MARIRTIKPEFFTSEDIVALSPLARLLYIAIWCEADKEGRLQWKPRTLKMRYLPADDCDIVSICCELIEQGLVILYGEGLAYVPGFASHQHVNPRESASALPAPDGVSPTPRRITASVRTYVIDRDNKQCVRCGSKDDLTLDHILPQSLDGPHIAENLRVMCRPCNSARPVAGQGLHDDLAKDGLTVNRLLAKFGIDASARVGTRAHQDLTRREEGEGREGKGKEGEEVASRRVDQPLPPLPPSAESEVERIGSRRALFDRIEGLCRRALGQHQPHDLRIGPMVDLIEQGYTERQIIDALSSAARRPRKKPVNAWSLWAKIIVEDELPPIKKLSEADAAKLAGPTIEFPSGAKWPVEFVIKALREFRDTEYWSRTALGPPPGEAGCGVPADLITQYVNQPDEVAA
jgi:hypothetical protein